MQPPPLSSGPNHVWVYLANLLITKYNVAGKRAIEIAVKWELGGGSDLRYSHITEINYFEGLFGKDFGYFLFRGLREDLRDEFYSGYWGWFLHCKYFGLIIRERRRRMWLTTRTLYRVADLINYINSILPCERDFYGSSWDTIWCVLPFSP